MLLMVIVELPLLVIVKVLCADDPTVTLPNARLPLSKIIRVGVTTVFNTVMFFCAFCMIPPIV